MAPDVIREAVFSYTVLAELSADSETQSDVKIIDKSLQMLVLIVQHNESWL